jgi:NAD(P)-dependent dehydrogenase (short-subunit alcohol dehydrogenase family)
VDLLVNNAGVLGPLGPFALNAITDWWRTLEIDLLGEIVCARRVVSGMIARKAGRIVNVASGGGTYMLPNMSAYVTAKTALIRFSECLAGEVRDQGVSVFALSPGTVRTAMSEYSLNSRDGKAWIPWFRDIFDQGRDLPPERPAELLVILASGRADVLSGCLVQPQDDLERMIAAAGEIEKTRLYRLQLPRL